MGVFLLSPILSFFSRRLYASLHHSGAGRGLAYLVYLTCLFSALAAFLCQFLLLPLATSFTEWLVYRTPEIQLASSGIQLLDSKANARVTQPYLVKHPAFGPLYLIDTGKATAAELLADESKAFILIGKEHIVIRDASRNESRVFDLKEAMARIRETREPLPLTKKMMRRIAGQIQGLMIPFLLLLFAPIFFVWKLLAALFYSGIALILNLFRKERLRYSSLFTIACFAISPVTVIQWMSFSVPFPQIQISMLLAFVLTVAYLIYALFGSSVNPK